ncbi:hypothetical protein HDU67_002815, partial [Dinochytrium kinnereticum]
MAGERNGGGTFDAAAAAIFVERGGCGEVVVGKDVDGKILFGGGGGRDAESVVSGRKGDVVSVEEDGEDVAMTMEAASGVGTREVRTGDEVPEAGPAPIKVDDPSRDFTATETTLEDATTGGLAEDAVPPTVILLCKDPIAVGRDGPPR